MKKGVLITFLVIFFGVGFSGIAIQKGLIKIPEVKETEKKEEYNFKQSVEEYITKSFDLVNPSYSFMNYRDWEDGAGFIMLENTFEVNGVDHKYIARVGKDGIIYKLTIDGEEYISADADTLLEYMQEYAE